MNLAHILSNVKGVLIWLGINTRDEIDQVIHMLCDIILCHQDKIKGGLDKFTTDCEKITSEKIVSRMKEILSLRN